MTISPREWAAFVSGIAVAKGRDDMVTAGIVLSAWEQLGVEREDRVELAEELSPRHAPDAVLVVAKALL